MAVVPVVELANGVAIAVDVVAWAAVHAGTGYLVHRLPRSRLGDSWLFRRRRFERRSRYRRVLRIHRWKDRVPEAGALFAGGVSKRSLPDDDAGGIERFVVETRRAELGHWLAMAAAPLFVLWNPPVASVLLVLYGVVANLPFILIQRYNRLRADRVLAARRTRSRSSRPGRNGRSMP